MEQFAIQQKPVLFVLIGALTVLAPYSLVGAMQALMLSGALNYTTDRTIVNVLLWGSISIASVVGAILLILMVRRISK